MFVKRDLRKIEEILLQDHEKNLTELKLARREGEFIGGRITSLCNATNLHFLRNLTTLSLYNNSLDDLDSIGLLSNVPLRELNLGQNKLSSLPTEFGQLETLEVLWMESNLFCSIPECVFKLKRLKILRLSNNQINVVPSAISSLTDLENLALDNNRITTVPHEIGALVHLTNLVLRGNRIEALPSEVGELKSLELLSANDNCLATIPASISQLFKLQILYLNANPLTEFPEIIGQIEAHTLKKANLSNTNISKIPDKILNNEKCCVFRNSSYNDLEKSENTILVLANTPFATN